MLMLLQERELGELLGEIARRIFGNLGQIAALVFVFLLPLIETVRRNRREARERAEARRGAAAPRPAPSTPAREQAEREAQGRAAWEALLRGERPPEPARPAPARPEPTPVVPLAPPVPEGRLHGPEGRLHEPEGRLHDPEGRVLERERPAPPLVATASRPTPPVDEELAARRVIELDLARGRALRGGGTEAIAAVPAAASVARVASAALASARSPVRAPRTARELVLASEMLAGPLALRGADGGGSLPPGLAAW